MSDTHKERHSALRGESQERLDLRTTYELLDLSTAPILARTGTGSGLLAPVHWYGCISVNNNTPPQRAGNLKQITNKSKRPEYQMVWNLSPATRLTLVETAVL